MGGVAKMMPAGFCWLLLGVLLTFGAAPGPAQASKERHYDFFITQTNFSRLCQQKSILAVNGQFPGPTIYAHKGDVVVVNVYNLGNKNITVHWHGVDQPRNPWFDGPEYITQCPIRPGANFTYRIIFSDEEGTVWWHAHSDFDRATVHGAIVVHPKKGSAYPYPTPDRDIPIVLGEWWKADVEELFEASKHNGGDIPVSDVNTINGQPGDKFPCSKAGMFRVRVQHGKTYLLRLVNAGLTSDMFFAVAGHRLTVVGTDGRYLKPFTVDSVLISSGQTMDVLLGAPTNSSSNQSRYYMAARALRTNRAIQFTNATATAVLEYTDVPRSAGPPDFPALLPDFDAVAASEAYTAKLRSLASAEHPVNVPASVNERLLVTIALNVKPCPPNETCKGPAGFGVAASLNNVSFVAPSVDILDAYYYSIPGVYEPDFPNKPPVTYNFTQGLPLPQMLTKPGTKVKVVEYGTVVEVVFQNAAIQGLGTESHPMHLHGASFYVVGRGPGNFNETTDPAQYNLVDPPYQNTVTVPKDGWAAIRFRAANPGVWFMHCHFDRHTVWGMNTVFIVKNGKNPDEQMLPRPSTMPKC